MNAGRAILDRFREPSSWAGIAAILAVFIPPDVAQGVTQAAVGLAGLAAVVMREKGGA